MVGQTGDVAGGDGLGSGLFSIENLIPAVIEAGRLTLVERERGCEAQIKSDASPVTAADHASEAVLLAALARHAPGIPVVAEEECAAGRIPDVDARFFLVDPLDGTKEFIGGGSDFTVNVALVDEHRPIAGIVYAPARAQLWWGDLQRGKAFRGEVDGGELVHQRAIAVRHCAGAPIAVASKSHNTPATEAWLDAAGAGERVSIGSSLKFVLVASGEADVYPRAGPTMEWDTAAGDAVLRAAGGRTFDLDGVPLPYGKPRFYNPGFVATGPFDPPVLRTFMTDEQ
jgi:3'(2'), 5'-bisphosphate nucleotidase